MNELIIAKKKFVSHIKGELQMITKEDARSCYIKYYKKLK